MIPMSIVKQFFAELFKLLKMICCFVDDLLSLILFTNFDIVANFIVFVDMIFGEHFKLPNQIPQKRKFQKKEWGARGAIC